MTSIRVLTLLSALALGSCSLAIKTIAERCPVDDVITCADNDQAQILCNNGIEERKECAGNEVCFDNLGCFESVCGNGVVEVGEDCDSDLLDGANCSDATNGALPEGTLACDNANCVFDTSNCSLCGNEEIEGDEACENNDLNGEDCDSATDGENPNGLLRCNNDCTFNTNQCFGS